jgi:hypothetical protein
LDESERWALNGRGDRRSYKTKSVFGEEKGNKVIRDFEREVL